LIGMSIEEARTLWQPEGIYLNTASYGLPPAPAWNALQAALEEWRTGRTSWEHWNQATQAARGSFARLCGVPVEWVAVGGAASPLVGLVAASLPDRSRVLSTEAEFTSALWPFMAQGRGIEVSCVPVARLAEAIDSRTALVAFSAVQSSGGEVADLEGVADAARHHGALTLVDATQACGWLPLDGRRFDALVCAAYKWLMSPRGTAFMSVRPELIERLTPHSAGWYAGDDPHSSYYGPPLRLAQDARRLDVSPAWFSWVGAAPALELLLEIGTETIHQHDVRLANLFRDGLGLEPGDSAIVSAEVPGAEGRLRESAVMAAARAGMLRTSWHLYNTEDDVERVLEILSPVAAPRSRPGSGGAGGRPRAAPRR
jgi:selenocysteine lyase/cysteine desulfurase